ncbi:sulfatase-like hydrolase/transferase [bacterium]|nr:sulfatase-like hydrolase/transferase [bacterium]
MRFLCFTLFLLPVLSLIAKQPNILLIYTDDHSHRTVSSYPESYDWVKTPNMDALAANGVRFAHATIGTWCMPSRATVLTGFHQTGVKTMRMEGQYPGSEYDPKVCRYWPSVFREKGYQTAQIGKWHTGTDTGYGRDWDHQIVWNRPRYPENSGAYYYDQIIEKNGAQGKLTKGYSTDNYTDWALDYIHGRQGRKDDQPWFLWLCYGGVHGPFTPADRHMGDYPGIVVKDPADIYPPRPGKPEYSRNWEQWVKGASGQPVVKKGKGKGGIKTGTEKTLTAWVRQVNQAVRSLDEGVGQIVDALKETGQYENTLIVFTSDQGFAWGQHGFQVKLAPYDGNIRSPFIVSMPSRLPSGKVSNVPVSGTDIAPTLINFAGFDLPWKMHGKDLGPFMKSPQAKHGRQTAFTLYTGSKYGADTASPPTRTNFAGYRQYENHGMPWWVSLNDGRYKYIRTLLEGEVEELYDLKNDPDELINLATKDESQNELVKKMRSESMRELQRIKAPFLRAIPPVAKLP